MAQSFASSMQHIGQIHDMGLYRGNGAKWSWPEIPIRPCSIKTATKEQSSCAVEDVKWPAPQIRTLHDARRMHQSNACPIFIRLADSRRVYVGIYRCKEQVRDFACQADRCSETQHSCALHLQDEDVTGGEARSVLTDKRLEGAELHTIVLPLFRNGSMTDFWNTSGQKVRRIRQASPGSEWPCILLLPCFMGDLQSDTSSDLPNACWCPLHVC